MSGSTPYDLRQMLAEFPAEDDCFRTLWELRFGLPYPQAACPVCARPRRFYALHGRRAFACETCRHQLYPTAGTPLGHTRLPLREWFTTIVMLRGGPRPRSAREIHRHTKSSYKAVRRMRVIVHEALMGTVPYGEDAAASLPVQADAPYSRAEFEQDLRRLIAAA
jgi:transposase